ncbi:hypothetical protein ACRRTK_007876 [Alexandromys fortis]
MEQVSAQGIARTILVGDSGVGKTSLLVQFDQGKFIPGSFSATVGIGFTVSTHRLCQLRSPVCVSGCQPERGELRISSWLELGRPLLVMLHSRSRKPDATPSAASWISRVSCLDGNLTSPL